MDPFTCFGIIVHIGMILGHMHFYADVDFLLCNGFRCFLKVRVMEYFFGCRKIDLINNLCRSFAQKTESQRKEIFCDMLLSPVMHTDCTNARVNGESSYVFVCAVPDGGVLYFARGKKGHDGIKGTVVEDYQGNTDPRS